MSALTQAVWQWSWREGNQPETLPGSTQQTGAGSLGSECEVGGLTLAGVESEMIN